MKKVLFLLVVVLGAIAVLPGSASAVAIKPRPGPIIVPVSPDPEPIGSAN